LAETETRSRERHAGSILVLEDHDDVRELLKEFLERSGYSVVACASAVEALTVLQGGTPISLILMDLMMPRVSGFQFRSEMRDDAALRDIPVVVMTGGQHPSDYHANLNAVAYLQKPIDFDVLLNLVEKYC